MILGFESYTQDLSDYELNTLLPAMVAGMKNKIGKSNAITSTEAIAKMKKVGLKISGPRFRKVIHVIRVSGMVPGILGNSSGYWVAANNDEFLDYLVSINQRLDHIKSLKDSLTKQYADFKNKPDFQ